MRFIRVRWDSPRSTVAGDRSPKLAFARRGHDARPGVGDPPRLELDGDEVAAGLVPHAEKCEPGQVGMQRMQMGVEVRVIEVESRSDLVVEEGQIEVEASPEENAVERLVLAVGGSHRRALDLAQPRPHADTPFADEREVVLVQRQAGSGSDSAGVGAPYCSGLPPASITISLS